ncbi:MAG: hypothetical protein HC912_06290 [Saprospiraceae bacterium]|nr:hypothetical protein [Saprospiraceae bacterium]
MNKKSKIFISEDFIEVEVQEFSFRFFSGKGMWIDFTSTQVKETRESRMYKEFTLLGAMANALIRNHQSDRVSGMIIEYQIAINELDIYS